MSASPLERPEPSRLQVAGVVGGPATAPVVPLSGELRLQLRLHRRCATEHASLVRAMCMHDRSVLPRWHQDDRGRRNEHRGFHDVAKDGAYAGTVAWNNRIHWITYVVPAAIAQHRDVLRKHHVSETQLREWAKVKSGYAQQSNGRRCIVRPDRLAEVLGVTKRHVQNLNLVARLIGLESVATHGRMLTQNERYGCWERGSRQRGLATEVALTVPRLLRLAVDSFTPARGPASSTKSNHPRHSLHGLAAEQKGAAPPPHRQERRRRLKDALRLASDVVSAVPWLAAERPGRLAPTLMRFATAPTPWQARDVVDAIYTHNLLTGRGPIAAATIRTRPAAVLASILRGLDEMADHPNLDPFSGASEVLASVVVAVIEPCGLPGCDHGWVEDLDGRVRACPSCPPEVRASSGAPATRDPWAGDHLDGNGEPLF